MRPFHVLPIVLLLFALGALPSAARADCISDCLAGKDCSLNYSGACSNALSDCSTSCSSAEAQGPAYGALAYDRQNGAFGYAYQFTQENAAAEFALKSCAENGRNCEVVVTFSDACAALVAGRKEGKLFLSECPAN